jgi:uncharacterized protein Veg
MYILERRTIITRDWNVATKVDQLIATLMKGRKKEREDEVKEEEGRRRKQVNLILLCKTYSYFLLYVVTRPSYL